jgi:GntR family carbon starvation induced transcriptional regulator
MDTIIRSATQFELPVEKERESERTQASIVTDLIRRDIISGVFPPGSKLLLRVLSEQYGVGTIPLREALSRLAVAGFVSVIDQRGFRVPRASTEELLDIVRVLTRIEAEALEDAIVHGDLAWEGKIVSAFHQLSRVPKKNEKVPGTGNPEWEAAHEEFHAAILSACTSPWLLRLVGILRGHEARYRFLSIRATYVGKRDADAEYAAILNAILKRDVHAATSALVEHLNTTARLAVAAAMPKPALKSAKQRAPAARSAA